MRPIKSKGSKIDWVIFVFFLLVPFLGFWRNIPFLAKSHTVFFDNDFLGGFFPGWWHAAQLFGDWKSMLWDPTQSSGLPFLSLPYIGIFYLPKFLFYLIGHMLNLQGNIVFLAEYLPVFHLSLAGIFTYIFMRSIVGTRRLGSLFAGIVFMFNGAFIHNIVYPDNVMSVCWLPLLLLCYANSLKKQSLAWSAGGALVLAQSFLSGYPHGAVLNILMLISYGVFYVSISFKEGFSVRNTLRAIISLVVIVLLGYLLASVQLKGVFELSAQSVAMRIKMSPEQASEFLFHPFHIIYMFIPNFFGQRLVTYSYNYNYVGIFTLVLFALAAIFENKNKFFKLFFIDLFVFLVLSFGYHTYFHKLFYISIPGFDTFRRPAFIQYLVSFCFAVLAGMGLSALSVKLGPEAIAALGKFTKTVFRLFLVLIFICFMWFLAVAIFILANNNRNIENAMISINHLALFIVFFFISIALLWSIYKKNSGMHLPIKLGVIAFILVDLFSLIQNYDGINDSMDPRVFYSKNKVVDFLQEESTRDKFRSMLIDLPHRYNSSIYGIEQWGGYQGMAPGAYFTFSDQLINSTEPATKAKGYNLANIKFIVSSSELSGPSYGEFKLYKRFIVGREDKNFYVKVTSRGQIMQPGESFYVYINPACLPRAYLTGNIRLVSGKEEVFDMIKNAGKGGIAVIDVNDIPKNKTMFTSRLREYADAGSTKIVKYTNSKIIIEAVSQSPGVLVLSDIYYPGWHVYIDGKESEVLRVNSIFRGVFIDEGKHNIVFLYKSDTLRSGLLLSFIGLFICILIWIIRPKLL